MLYNETLNVIPSNDNKTCDSCVVYIILFCVVNNKYIYGYLCLFLFLFKKYINSHYFGCLNINGY